MENVKNIIMVILKFEGEYINGYKRKGREYIKGILVYEGNYLIDQKYEG